MGSKKSQGHNAPSFYIQAIITLLFFFLLIIPRQHIGH